MATRRALVIALLVALLLGAAFAAAAAAPGPAIALQILDKATGAFAIQANGVVWFQSAAVSVRANQRTFSSSDGSLALSAIHDATGTDALGDFTETRLVYALADGSGAFEVAIKLYADLPSVVFEQHFPSGFKGMSAHDADQLVSSFPTFSISDAPTDSQAPAAFAHWVSWYYGAASSSSSPSAAALGASSSLPAPGFVSPTYGAWNSTLILPGGIAGSGVTAVFSRDLSVVAVVSSLDQAMAVSHCSPRPGELAYGIMGRVDSLEPGAVFRTLVSFSGAGFNRGVLAWGAALRSWTGKPDASVARARDVTLQYIGFTTDNGMYYYYHTEGNTTYQDTLSTVHKYSVANAIPYRYVLLDSWWYYRSALTNGVTNWTERPDVFPAGLAELYRDTGWLVQAHNRYWAPETPYAKQNGGAYEFLTTAIGAVPAEERFWSDLFSTPKAAWGLRVYEQDWLNMQFGMFAADIYLVDATRGRTWLRQMHDGAAQNGLTIQYCMPNIRHVLASAEFPSVTQARASDDAVVVARVPGIENWRIGGQSLLFDALGLAPSKDGFWTTSVQPGNPYGDHVTEPTPRLQSAIATLSAGPVAIGDGVNYTNRSLLMRSCRADGRLLQPSRPATPLDCTVLDAALGNGAATGDCARGTVWFAPTADSVLGARVFGSLIVIDMLMAARVVPADLHGLDAAAEYWAVESNWTHAPSLFSSASPLSLPAVQSLLDFQVWSVAPVERVGGWAFLGETDKWAAVTPVRFSSIESFDGETGAGMRVQAMGSIGETVNVAFVTPRGSVVRVACEIGESSSVMMGSDGVCSF